MVSLAAFFAGVANAETLTNLDNGWKFHFGDVKGAEIPSFDDTLWERVSVPHDWAIGKPFDISIDRQFVKVFADGDKTFRVRTGRTGALPCFGTGWYRTDFALEKSDEGRRVAVQFDGAMSRAKIYVNGEYAGEWPYGYASFEIDVTKFAKFGRRNVLAVRLENPSESSRWYSGAGLYRPVRLVVRDKTHIPIWGVWAHTKSADKNSAEVEIKTDVANFDGAKTVVVENSIIDANGSVVASANREVALPDGAAKHSSATVLSSVVVKNPALWDTENPNLYTIKTTVSSDGKIVDTHTAPFGVRTIKFSRENGFELNGKRTKFKGVCLHHDLGPIGAAVNETALWRQLTKMKAMGCNAVRTTHNPPANELLDMCDKLGLLVIAEAFDEWKTPKCKNGYNTLFDNWAEKDLRAMIKRCRPHPSVIMWSIGNEVPEQVKGAEGAARAKFLADIARDEDSTRPTTAGMDHYQEAAQSGFASNVDVQGLNYKPHQYADSHKKYSTHILYGSETASTVSSRGAYHFPVVERAAPWHKDYQTSSYDTECCPWSQVPETEWSAQDDNDFVMGEFVWTGTDYLGEPAPYDSLCIAKSSYFGIVDLCGFEKDRFYFYKSRWLPSEKVLHILPHWNWPDRIGQNVPVHVYTNYPEVELFVNGKSMGKQKKTLENKRTRYRMMWNDVSYAPGELKAVAYDESGKAVAEKIVKTAGEPARVKLIPETDKIKADGKDLCYIRVQIQDKDGNVCPRAENIVFFDVSGNGRLRATCNGNPVDLTAFSSDNMRAFSGELLLIVDSPSAKKGEITVSATSGRIKPDSVKIFAE